MKLTLTIFVLLLAVLNINLAIAGQCIPPELDAEYIKNTDLIFEGHLSEIMSEASASAPAQDSETIIDNLTITKLFKGNAEGDVIIRQHYYHAMSFHAGKSYLVFADRYSDDSYFTSGCSANEELGDETSYKLNLLEGYLGLNKEKEKE